ncbi:MAG: hypothetical protein VZQ50_04465 [Lachnospiraceae bacterium]|nr:hypothetical protein [Lachnospiraceae bacterium]
MKKYREFIVVLVLLIASIICGLYVLMTAIRNGGDFFGRQTEEVTTEATTETKTRKKKAVDQAYEDETIGTLLIGDSRFVGMNKALDVENDKDRQWLVAKVGQGLGWFQDSALPSVQKIRDKNTAISKWRYVIGLGVNDLKNINNYIDEYKDLTESDDQIELILLSVNPVDDGNSYGISNADIKSFNKKLKEACDENGWAYIDTYSQLVEDGYSTVDGLHYENATYLKVYDYILDGLAELGESTDAED